MILYFNLNHLEVIKQQMNSGLTFMDLYKM